ncbi:HAD-IA family hydrolase [Nonomuraea phyllanthi]|uniref:HAD family hydrolase n=1 Tax=Nonomuraea phyllanthi TaxID=2219224 RepID=UPI001293A6AD|nr:HAD family hydrolase [Nonomuraea phyllanthi]QFY11698.1 HAD-IA family hydrolase [Nonomuraea phyllanthi]
MTRPLALFDLDNTLIDRLAAFKRWAAGFAAERRLGDDAVPWLVALDADGSLPMDAFFSRVRERFGLPEPAGELWLAYRARFPLLVSCRGEVLDGLGRLRAAGWVVGIVTNGMADNQTGKLERTGLAARVDGWAISEAEGVRKPDVRLFEIAARRCGAELGAGGWVVGDDPVKDIQGGRAAGLRTIWIDRGVTAGSAGEGSGVEAGGGSSAVAADHAVGDVLSAIELLIRSGSSSG